MLVRLLRSLGVLLVVFVTSVAVAIPSWALAPAPEGAPRFLAKTATTVGTKAAPLRFLTCGSVPGLVACTAAAGGLYWLTETDSGREFSSDVMDDLAGLFGTPRRTTTYCTGTVEPSAWSQQQVLLSGVFEGPGIPIDNSGGRKSCQQAFDEGSISLAEIQADCIRADGTLYRVGAVYNKYNQGAIKACSFAATDWLIGITTYDSGTLGGTYKLGNPGYFKNGTWNGVPGADSQWWDDNVHKPQTRATIECLAADGTKYTKTVTVAGVVDPPLACDGTGALIGRTVDVLRNAGKLVTRMYDVDVTPEAIGQYPECFTGGQWCDMAVTIDGIICEYGRAGCDKWWDIAQQEPWRVKCVWGPYTLGYGDCREFRDAYVSPDGAWIPVDAVPGVTPIPYYPANPDYRPPAGTGGSDPAWVNTAHCPYNAAFNEYGLQPIAVQGLRCFMAAHPDFAFTSGWRPAAEGVLSDHPHGLAIDLAPPAWDTPAGNQRGWDATAYWITNAEVLGVRYLIFDRAIWWPSSGWKTYVDPDGSTHPHNDHVHVSFDGTVAPSPTSAPTTAPTLPYPQPTPSTETSTPTNPSPAPTTGTTPSTGFPTTGTNPADPDNCMAATWTWNPADWVLVPTKCALRWAFVPSAAVLAQVETTIGQSVDDTGVTVWLDTVEALPASMAAPETPTAGCMGPPMDLPDPMPTMYVFEACDGIRATMAAYVKSVMTVGLVVGVLLTCTTLLGRGFGYDASVGKGSAA